MYIFTQTTQIRLLKPKNKTPVENLPITV